MRTDTKTADKTEELLEQLHDGIETLTTTEAWTAWLDVARRLPSYSLNNLILIWTQMPEATQVAGYRAWKQLDRQVRKGERGLRILAPCTYKQTDEATGHERSVLRGFRSVAVFDISQTDGAPLPSPPVTTLTGDVPRLFRQQLSCLIRAEGFTFRQGPMPRGHEEANGVTDWGSRTVTVRDDLGDAQAAKTTAHELAHVLLHGPRCRLERGLKEVEAESVAYLVCATAGLDASDYSFGYVAGWAGGDLEVIAGTAGRVLETARSVIARLTPSERQTDVVI